MHLDLDAPRRMSSLRREQLAFAQLSRIIRRIRGQARGTPCMLASLTSSTSSKFSVNWRACDILAPMVVFWPPELPLKSGELCGKTRHTFFGSARLVSGPYSVCMADSTAPKFSIHVCATRILIRILTGT